jgi:hypothetical protein
LYWQWSSYYDIPQVDLVLVSECSKCGKQKSTVIYKWASPFDLNRITELLEEKGIKSFIDWMIEKCDIHT